MVIKKYKYWDNHGVLGVALEVWLERWKEQYDDIPSLEQLKWSYPDVPETSLKGFVKRIFYNKGETNV